jgi:hypothetical protein
VSSHSRSWYSHSRRARFLFNALSLHCAVDDSWILSGFSEHTVHRNVHLCSTMAAPTSIMPPLVHQNAGWLSWLWRGSASATELCYLYKCSTVRSTYPRDLLPCTPYSVLCIAAVQADSQEPAFCTYHIISRKVGKTHHHFIYREGLYRGRK